jgi:hypothetical protein
MENIHFASLLYSFQKIRLPNSVATRPYGNKNSANRNYVQRIANYFTDVSNFKIIMSNRLLFHSRTLLFISFVSFVKYDFTKFLCITFFFCEIIKAYIKYFY